ncbi:MAG: sigma-54-dependent Fis family transcriptional regulator [Acidobacteria bacterium]|nr:sigma-54-dependent Fis family transcriptional regulator [Acidobacteriota bacterium]
MSAKCIGEASVAKTARIVVCDDEPSIRKTLSEVLGDEGFTCESVASGEALLNHLKSAEQRIDLVLLDVWLPGMDGVETLSKLREMGFKMPVIVISGHATLDSAVKATRLGAFDFLEKPLNLDRVLLSVQNALKQAHLERKEKLLRASQDSIELIGQSEAMARVREEIELAAPTPGRVLILGESGSGKEVAARLIHQLSDRRDEPFIEMNCAAIPEELIESELFGHMKGSFTGAVENRPGKFEQADGGTLFLDEIGDMSLNTQAKVLRVLQEQRFQRIGGHKTIQVDVRVIAATNKDLSKEIKNGTFREDLYFRLSVVPLEIPPLRARLEDLPLLIHYFFNQFSQAYGRKSPELSEDALRLLASYHWPGNVRELRNVAERLMIMMRKPIVEVKDLPANIRGSETEELWFGNFTSLKDARDYFEKKFIEYHLRRNEGNISRTADIIQLERSHLHRKIKQYGISHNGSQS